MSKTKLCKACSKEVAKTAKICPHCGAKLKMGIVKKFGIGMGIIIILIIFISGGEETQPNKTTSSTSTPENTIENTTQTEDKQKRDLKWDTSDTNINNNNNMDTAVSLIKSDGDLRSKAAITDPASVAKAPFKYYGKVIQATGEIVDIQDYAAGNDWSNNLGGDEAGQIVIVTDDETAIDMFVVGSTGDLKNGDIVTLYGYPIGLVDVDNKLGGKTTQLAIVGNSFDKQQ